MVIKLNAFKRMHRDVHTHTPHAPQAPEVLGNRLLRSGETMPRVINVP